MSKYRARKQKKAVIQTRSPKSGMNARGFYEKRKANNYINRRKGISIGANNQKKLFSKYRWLFTDSKECI